MNTITVLSDHLAAALKHSVASARSPMNVLQHARLRVDNGQLLVESTDCEVWVQARIPSECTEPFDVLLHDELLRSAATAGGGALTIRQDGRITSARGRYAVPALAAADFPAAADDNWQAIEVDTAALRAAIRGVSYTGEDQGISAVFRSVHVNAGLVWCTDGKQMAAIALDYDGPRIAIPVGQVRRVLDALEQQDATVSVGNVQGDDAGLLRIDGPELQVSLRLGTAGAMDMARFVRGCDLGGSRVVIRRDELLQAMRRFMPFINYAMGQSKSKTKGLPTVRLSMADEGLELSDKTGEFNERLAGADLGEAGSGWRIAFDAKRVIAVLSLLADESIELWPLAVNGPTKLLAILPQGKDLEEVAHLLALIVE